MRALVASCALSAASMVPFATQAAETPATQSMSVVRNGEQASIMGAPGNFVGSVRVDPLFAPRAP